MNDCKSQRYTTRSWAGNKHPSELSAHAFTSAAKTKYILIKQFQDNLSEEGSAVLTYPRSSSAKKISSVHVKTEGMA